MKSSRSVWPAASVTQRAAAGKAAHAMPCVHKCHENNNNETPYLQHPGRCLCSSTQQRGSSSWHRHAAHHALFCAAVVVMELNLSDLAGAAALPSRPVPGCARAPMCLLLRFSSATTTTTPTTTTTLFLITETGGSTSTPLPGSNRNDSHPQRGHSPDSTGAWCCFWPCKLQVGLLGSTAACAPGLGTANNKHMNEQTLEGPRTWRMGTGAAMLAAQQVSGMPLGGGERGRTVAKIPLVVNRKGFIRLHARSSNPFQNMKHSNLRKLYEPLKREVTVQGGGGLGVGDGGGDPSFLPNRGYRLRAALHVI